MSDGGCHADLYRNRSHAGSWILIAELKVLTTSRSPSSYRRSCADERACQGWRSHHVVTPKAPFTRPIGKSDNCADEEWGRCPPAAGRDSLTRRRLGRGRSVPPRLADQGDSYADPSGLTRTRRSIVNTGSQRRAVAVGQCRSPESQPRDLLGATQRLIAGPPGPERGTSGRAGQRRGAARLRAALIP